MISRIPTQRTWTYPSALSSFSRPGTLAFHHCQSVADLGKTLPDLVLIKVESYMLSSVRPLLSLDATCSSVRLQPLTRSKPAIRRCFSVGGTALPVICFPMITLVPMTRHVIGPGFFCEAGVKKFATDFSIGSLILADGNPGRC